MEENIEHFEESPPSESIYMSDDEDQELNNNLTHALLSTIADSIVTHTAKTLKRFNRLSIQNVQNIVLLTILRYYESLLDQDIINTQDMLELVNLFNTDFNGAISDYIYDSGDDEEDIDNAPKKED